MIDDMELLRMIMENNPGQPASFILEQFSTYKNGLLDINSRFHSCSDSHEGAECAVLQESVKGTLPSPAMDSKKESLTRGYTKRNLRVNPEEAIQEDKIICCICKMEGKILTERHLAQHNGLTREGYIKLCGYPQDQALMARTHLIKMQGNVRKAQEARKAKHKSTGDTLPRGPQRKKMGHTEA